MALYPPKSDRMCYQRRDYQLPGPRASCGIAVGDTPGPHMAAQAVAGQPRSISVLTQQYSQTQPQQMRYPLAAQKSTLQYELLQQRQGDWR